MHHYRDMEAWRPKKNNFFHTHPIRPQLWQCFPGSRWMMFALRRVKALANDPKISFEVFQIPTCMITMHQPHRQTDGQHAISIPHLCFALKCTTWSFVGLMHHSIQSLRHVAYNDNKGWSTNVLCWSTTDVVVPSSVCSSSPLSDTGFCFCFRIKYFNIDIVSNDVKY